MCCGGRWGEACGSLPDEDRLMAAWPVACGSALAGHAQVMYLDAENWLHVRVEGAQWMQQFVAMRSALAMIWGGSRG